MLKTIEINSDTIEIMSDGVDKIMEANRSITKANHKRRESDEGSVLPLHPNILRTGVET